MLTDDMPGGALDLAMRGERSVGAVVAGRDSRALLTLWWAMVGCCWWRRWDRCVPVIRRQASGSMTSYTTQYRHTPTAQRTGRNDNASRTGPTSGTTRAADLRPGRDVANPPCAQVSANGVVHRPPRKPGPGEAGPRSWHLRVATTHPPSLPEPAIGERNSARYTGSPLRRTSPRRTQLRC